MPAAGGPRRRLPRPIGACLPLLCICALGERVTDALRAEEQVGLDGALRTAAEVRRARRHRREDVGVVPGLALLCAEDCGEVVDRETLLVYSPLLDAMDYSKVKVGFVLDPCPNQVCRVQTCAQTHDAAELGFDVHNVGRVLAETACTMVLVEMDLANVMNIPEVDPEAPDFLLFRGSRVRDFLGFVRMVGGLTTPEPSTLGALLGHDRAARELAARAETFAAVLVWYYAGVKGQRKMARLRLWALEQERLGMVAGRLVAEAFDEEERSEREDAVAKIAAALGKIEALVQAEFAQAPALAGACEAQALTPAARGLREKLDALSKDQRKADVSAMKDIAVASFEAAFAGLCVAADLGVPGIGSALNAARAALNQVVSYAKGLMHPAVRKAIGTAQQVLAEIEGAPSGLKLGGLGDAVASSVWTTAVEASPDAVIEGVQATEHLVAAKAARCIEAAKTATQAVLTAGATEGAWTAVEFIPFVGTFVGLGRGLATLNDVSMAAYQSKQGYFRAQDPVLRSLFRMRDCALDSVRNLGAVRLAANPSNSWETRAAALISALDAAEAAAAINEDLLSRLFQQVWLLQSRAANEDAAMARLRTGSAGLYGSIPANTSVGDAYLSADTLSPTDWQARLGDAIRRHAREIRAAALQLPAHSGRSGGDW